MVSKENVTASGAVGGFSWVLAALGIGQRKELHPSAGPITALSSACRVLLLQHEGMRHSFETENWFLSSQRETSILDPDNEVFCYSTYFSLDSVWFVCSLCPALMFKERGALGVAWREFSKSCLGGKCCFSPGWFLTPLSEVLPS